jgi:hypothetical protein
MQTAPQNALQPDYLVDQIAGHVLKDLASAAAQVGDPAGLGEKYRKDR